MATGTVVMGLAAVTGCRTAAPRPAVASPAQPAVPAATSAAAAAAVRQPATAATRADSTLVRANPADVQFMQHMMVHHAQALAMTALVPARSTQPALRLVAERIEVSQHDEIALMRRWLADRGAPVPALDAAPAGGQALAHDPAMPGMTQDTAAMPMMPGMLTPAALARLRQATGAAFDRLFLTSMIRHHEGALSMVASFFATRGAGQDSEIFRFASDVDADQRAEIRRMRALLGAS